MSGGFYNVIATTSMVFGKYPPYRYLGPLLGKDSILPLAYIHGIPKPKTGPYTCRTIRVLLKQVHGFLLSASTLTNNSSQDPESKKTCLRFQDQPSEGQRLRGGRPSVKERDSCRASASARGSSQSFRALRRGPEGRRYDCRLQGCCY